MAKNNNLTDFLTDVANAIREKKGTSDPINPQNFSDEIASIETGGGGGSGGTDVVFRDYDGAVLHSFSADEFLAMSELPALPMQQGLICQGWNYELADAQSYVNLYGALEIGATYITNDGKTRLYINIASKARMTVPLYFSQSVANGVSIDWGDGSMSPLFNTTGNITASHTYGDVGDYVISLEVADGCILSLGHNTTSYCVIGDSNPSNNTSRTMLQKVEFGKNVDSIKNGTFYSCSSLESVVIPEGVSSITEKAFQLCGSLRSVVIPKSLTSSIPGYCFGNCYALTHVMLPKSITAIANYAFNYCQSLRFLAIPASAKSISGYAFQYCGSLESVVIPEGITSIGTYAFSYCQALKQAPIPSTVTSIGSRAFQYCEALYSVEIPEGVTTLSSYMFKECSSLKLVTLPTTLRVIDSYAFDNCNGLVIITIPESVTNMYSRCFYNCYCLRKINIPPRINLIEENSFYSCSSLAEVEFPAGITKFGSAAFSNCSGMGLLDFRKASAVPTLNASSVFTSIAEDCKIVVPDALYEAWCAASNWSTYASRIVKASEYTE